MVYLVFLSGIYYMQAIQVLASVKHNEETITNVLIIAKTNFTIIAKLVTISIGTLMLLFKS